MAIIEIDDGLYLNALQYIWGGGEKEGIGAAFEHWIRASDRYETWEKDNLSSLFAGLIGHYSGEYDVESGWSKEKRVV